MKKQILAAILIGAVVIGSPIASAADRRQVRALNIGAQALTTLASAAIQGKVRNWSDIARCLGVGAVAGYGTFEAKILVSKDHVQTGWLVANLASSFSENVAAGKNPLAQLGYTIGPIRVRVAIPALDRNGDAFAYVDASVYQLVTLYRSFDDNDRMKFRSGMISFERDSLYPEEDGVGPFVGTAWGVYPAVWIGAEREVWNHEVIHAIQSLQGDSVEPPLPVLTYHPSPAANGERRLVRFEHLKIGTWNIASDYFTGRQNYEDRWTEIEAYRLSENVDP